MPSVLEEASAKWLECKPSADGGIDPVAFLAASSAITKILDLLTGMGIVRRRQDAAEIRPAASSQRCPQPPWLLISHACDVPGQDRHGGQHWQDYD